MIEGTSTILVIFLLLVAASLVSYLFSRLGVLRGADGTFAWAGIGLGALLLITAVVIVALAVTQIPKLLLTGTGGVDEPMLRPARLNSSIPQRDSSMNEAPAPPRAASDEGASVKAVPSRSQDEPLGEPSSTPRDDSNASSIGHSSFVDTTLRDSIRAAVGSSPGVILGSAPWAATQCVVPLRRDPADMVRWTIVNDCGAPVGILVAICMSEHGCGQPGAVAWRYPADEMVLPAKYQRSVTQAEETRYGRQIDHAACIVTNPVAIRLIGMSAELRSTAEWQTEFGLVRETDPCLRDVRGLAAAGRHTGMSIGALLGDALPAEAPDQGAQRF